jgi:uncharacterized protein YjbI with pentapeptide repeats
MTSDAPSGPFDGDDAFADLTFADVAAERLVVRRKDFQRCVFRRCKLPESAWAESRLEDCVFEDCDLTRMVPRGLGLRGVAFTGSKLMGVDWSDVASLPDFGFDRCDLRYATFTKLRLRGLKMIGCNAREASFVDIDLTEADFTGSELAAATIHGCTLARANMAGASGVLFDPQRNRPKGARISVEAALAIVRYYGIVVEPGP